MPKESTAPQSAETLRNIAVQISDTAAMLRSVADGLEPVKIDTLIVKNYSNLTLGMKSLDSFASAVKEAYRDAREARGDFRAGEVTKDYVSGSKAGRAKK